METADNKYFLKIDTRDHNERYETAFSVGVEEV